MAYKELEFCGASYEELIDFPKSAMREAGFQLSEIQMGREPDDWKPMPSIGAGVNEIRIWDSVGAFRVIYVAKFRNAIYVLHCFQKKTQKTEKRNLDIAKARLKTLLKELTND